MKLECQKCGKEWNYTGESDYYATCPNCKTSVNIEKQQVEPENE